MSGPSVTVENLSKCYRVFPDARHRMKELLSFGRKKYAVDKWALRDVSFELFPGQALGIVGINGSGKSTLLKILTGTTRQTSGSFEINGNLSSLLELGAGFHADFSGKQNIYMNAVMQGVGKDEVDARYQHIADFTELGDALDRPVRTYSSGMAMRLGFAASMLARPDVLILDEVLAVGDAYFQKKCMAQFAEFRTQEKTILFVSHSVYHVREICDRAIWLHQGEMVMDGNPLEVTDEYETRLLEAEGRANRVAETGEAVEMKAGLAKIERVMLSDPEGLAPQNAFETGDPFALRTQIRVPEGGEDLQIMVGILRNDGLLVLSGRQGEPRHYAEGRHIVTCDIPRLPLLAGEYMVSVYVTDATGAHIGDQILNVERFRVSTPRFEKGLVLAEYSFRHTPADELGLDLREIKA
jgi:ABC-type polysaccharide/polyol phosphate transport system ATPase subunit